MSRKEMSVTNPMFSYYDDNANWLGDFNSGDVGEANAIEKAFSRRVARPHDFKVYVKAKQTVGFWKWKREITYWKHQFSVGIWWCDSMPKKKGFIDYEGKKVPGR